MIFCVGQPFREITEVREHHRYHQVSAAIHRTHPTSTLHGTGALHRLVHLIVLDRDHHATGSIDSAYAITQSHHGLSSSERLDPIVFRFHALGSFSIDEAPFPFSTEREQFQACRAVIVYQIIHERIVGVLRDEPRDGAYTEIATVRFVDATPCIGHMMVVRVAGNELSVLRDRSSRRAQLVDLVLGFTHIGILRMATDERHVRSDVLGLGGFFVHGPLKPGPGFVDLPGIGEFVNESLIGESRIRYARFREGHVVHHTSRFFRSGSRRIPIQVLPVRRDGVLSACFLPSEVIDVVPLGLNTCEPHTQCPDLYALLVRGFGEGEVGLKDELVGGVEVEKGIVRSAADHAESVPSCGGMFLHLLAEEASCIEVVVDFQGLEGLFEFARVGRKNGNDKGSEERGAMEHSKIHPAKVGPPCAALDHLCAPRSTTLC